MRTVLPVSLTNSAAPGPYRKVKETHKLIFSSLSRLAVLLVPFEQSGPGALLLGLAKTTYYMSGFTKTMSKKIWSWIKHLFTLIFFFATLFFSFLPFCWELGVGVELLGVIFGPKNRSVLCPRFYKSRPMFFLLHSGKNIRRF